MANDEYEIECMECGWSGDRSELIALTEDLDDRDFSYCPKCISKNLVDID